MPHRPILGSLYMVEEGEEERLEGKEVRGIGGVGGTGGEKGGRGRLEGRKSERKEGRSFSEGRVGKVHVGRE